MSKKGLGRGLQALIPDIRSSQEAKLDNQLESSQGVQQLPVNKVKPRKDQPRRHFSEEKIAELAQSIQEHGVIQPIVVRKNQTGYEIVAGERRWRACKIAGLTEIPVIIKNVEEVVINELALIENLQRENLNPIEEAIAFQKLVNQFKVTQEQLAQRLGKSRPYIANALRLNNLPAEIQQQVASGELTAGHVRPLLIIKNKAQQITLAAQIVKKGLSVRQTEELVKSLEQNMEKPGEDNSNKKNANSPILGQVEDKLRSRFGTAVKIKAQGNKGKIEIAYYDDDDFNRILELVLGDEEF